jgi:hypothetical protein
MSGGWRALLRAACDVPRLRQIQNSIYSGTDGIVVFFAFPLELGLMRLEVSHAPRDVGAF